MTQPNRCSWCGSDPLYVAYHDDEWGVPVYDDRTLFEFLILEGAQAGLSWSTILKKRTGYRLAFDGFDAATIARYDAAKVAALLADEQTAFEESDRGDVYVGAPAFELDEGAVLGREPLVVPHLAACYTSAPPALRISSAPSPFTRSVSSANAVSRK